jgi:hypothetical protein
MDNDNNISAVLDTGSERRDLRHLNLTLVEPFEPQLLTGEEFLIFWNHIRTQEYMFDDFNKGNMDAFFMALNEPGALHFRVPNRAYIVLRNLTSSDNAGIHYCVWDRTMPFREILACGREIVDFAFVHLKVHRISATIPMYNEQAAKFATLLGFAYEGKMKEAILKDERHWDVDLYGLLKSKWASRKRAQ